ncbi:MAG: mandelate racemase/muconate lactonizing enzyme family protein [Anaerolineae bacterium]|nr:mandelate racemase/muconate lactonizing enzyme family protein [Anaerolineae bacterium]
MILPEPWSAAWWEPSGLPKTALGFSIYRLTTEDGLIGIGPYTGADPKLAVGREPFDVGRFWAQHMSGIRSDTSGRGASGLEIALWDLVGKASNQPIHRLLGSRRDRLLVYAATSRILSKEALVDEVLALQAQGFRAIKLRLHRQDVRQDIAAVVAVRKVLGDGVMLMVDANQNNQSEGYPYWSRLTALRVAQELDGLGLYFLEEPLPRTDVEGLAEIAATVDMYIAGGEHTPTVYDWRPYLHACAYDILQPDLVMGGNLGIIGARKVAEYADAFGRLVIPHVLMSGAAFPLCLVASLHAMATVDNCPMVEYPYDPPVLTEATTQSFITEPLHIDPDGCIALPDKPGLGIELDEDRLRSATGAAATVVAATA